MKFHIRTLGCKMNWLDSARLSAALHSAGHQAVEEEAEADFLFVNTCTVTAEADRKSRQTVNRAGRRQQQVAVMGCGPRVDGSDWQQQGERLIFADESAMFRHFGIEEDEATLPLHSRTRLPVAIQTGCDNRCSFCITRIARGAHRSLPAERIVRQIAQAAEHGIGEVVLTGINLAAWGCDDSNRPGDARLHQLLETILERTAIPRIRISSIGPQFIQPAFFDLYQDERICDYLHISLQSGSDSVLQRMVRGHGTEEVAWIAERARAVRAETALSADVIAGFPGETDAEHGETLAFLRRIGFAKLHVFPFSVREGTPAATLSPQVVQEVKKERAGEIRELARRMRGEFVQSQLGKRLSVLVEGNGTGLSGNYLRLHTGSHPQGAIVPITVDESSLVERNSPRPA
ncbi:MAG: MiaB/RimO family radical SAM methylthiotransferase [Pseudomonadota bacterium]